MKHARAGELIAWDQAPKWGKAKKHSANEASRAGDWGRERAAHPGDMPFMPPIHDTRFWYHALIGQSVHS